MSRRVFLFNCTLFLLLSVQLTFSQKQRPIGTWKMFLPYGQSVGICDAGNVVYSAAHQGIFSYEKSTGTIQTYDKSTGLSDVNVQGIYYDPATSVLVVAYLDGNLDFIYSGTTIVNLPDLMLEASVQAININSISFNQGNAYISTNIGISVIGLSNPQINNTYIIGSTGSSINVYSSSFDSINIYAATDEGIKYAPLNSANLLDFHSWALFGPSQNIPAAKAALVADYNNKLYAVIGNGTTDTLYEYNGSTWNKKFYSSLDKVESLTAVDGNLYFGVWYDSVYNNGNSTSALGFLGKINLSDSLIIQPTQGGIRPLYWFESDGKTWDGDYYNGLFINNQSIVPDGPYTSNVFRMNIQNHVVNVAAGGVDDSWLYLFNPNGFYIYKDNSWINRTPNTFDILSAASIPSTGKTYFGSYYSGLIIYDDATGELTYYDKNNSPNGILEAAVGDSSRTKVTCLTVDQNNNLWIGSAEAPHQIKVIGSDGKGREYSVPYNFQLTKQILFDQNGQMWAPVRGTGNNSLLVWNYNNTLDDTTDDASIMLSTGTGSGGLPDGNAYCVAQDMNGNIWVGTDQGIGIYYCAQNVLQQGGCDAQQIKVVGADGYVAYLFGSESVRALAVDAANRIWVGTTNGAWLISDDGQTQYLNFNASNSPMPNNQVTDIQIDNETGEVFIGTLGGLVSYQGDAIGGCSDCNSACVYPNPVRPGYTGPIAIKCLTDNAYVKITDATGTLIYQGAANGTQMIWNGNNYNGVRAKSGVYLVFSSDALGQSKQVAKILLMN